MLRKIPAVITPDLMHALMSMGHSDVIIIADANFPGDEHSKRYIRMDGIMIPDILEAILPFFPLDNFVPHPVKLMKTGENDPTPESWDVYRQIVKKHDKDNAFTDFGYIDRLEFYKMAETSYMVVQTGDVARYGCIVLQKGVVDLPNM